MTRCRDVEKQHKNGSFPQDFFQKSGSITFVPLVFPNFMQKIRKELMDDL